MKKEYFLIRLIAISILIMFFINLRNTLNSQISIFDRKDIKDAFVASDNHSSEMHNPCRSTLTKLQRLHLLLQGYYKMSKASVTNSTNEQHSQELIDDWARLKTLRVLQNQLLVDKKRQLLVCDGGMDMYKDILAKTLNIHESASITRIEKWESMSIYMNYTKIALFRHPYTSLVWSYMYADRLTIKDKKKWGYFRNVDFSKFVGPAIAKNKPSSFSFLSEACVVCHAKYDFYIHTENHDDMLFLQNLIINANQPDQASGKPSRPTDNGKDSHQDNDRGETSAGITWIPGNVMKVYYSWIKNDQRSELDSLMSAELELLNYSLAGIY